MVSRIRLVVKRDLVCATTTKSVRYHHQQQRVGDEVFEGNNDKPCPFWYDFFDLILLSARPMVCQHDHRSVSKTRPKFDLAVSTTTGLSARPPVCQQGKTKI